MFSAFPLVFARRTSRASRAFARRALLLSLGSAREDDFPGHTFIQRRIYSSILHVVISSLPAHRFCRCCCLYHPYHHRRPSLRPSPIVLRWRLSSPQAHIEVLAHQSWSHSHALCDHNCRDCPQPHQILRHHRRHYHVFLHGNRRRRPPNSSRHCASRQPH
jgi:hypothetical protein